MKIHLAFIVTCTFLLWGSTSAREEVSGGKDERTMQGVLGTYANPPRLANRRVDISRLLGELQDLNANTYNWLIWREATDWKDLKLFLPQAKKAGIKVWVTIVPPSESKPITQSSSEPFGLDYETWAKEIALLSVKYPNLEAWSIDDFAQNQKFYTPEYLEKILGAVRTVNPKLAFVPCCYFLQITPSFAANYGHMLDGIYFPYNAASSPKRNLQDVTFAEKEVIRVRELFGSKLPVFLVVYASAHSHYGDTTPGYVKDILTIGRKIADGVIIYCHQDPEKSPEKYQAIKLGFN
jgi:hypothetical protein